MDFNDRLTEVFDRGLREGVDSLSPADRDVFRIQDFIIEYEMNGISGYFYNRLPDVKGIFAAVAAMRECGLAQLADLLEEAATLFANFSDPPVSARWSDLLTRYDPEGALDRIDRRISALRNYGIE